jgi:hypothetical protein
MNNRHKLKEEGPPQDTVVSDVKIGHFKCQHLSPLVFSCPTRHLHADASDGGGRLSWYDPIKSVMHGGQIGQIEVHLDKGLPHHQVKRSPTVDQSLVHLATSDRDLNDERQVSA